MIYHSHHGHRDAFGSLADLGETVGDAVKTIRPHRHEFDAIVVTGVSGLLVGPAVALTLDAPLLVLRKHKDDTHQGYALGRFANERDFPPNGRFLFLDDFVSRGDTRVRVRQAVEQHGGHLVATYTYREDSYDPGPPYAAKPSITSFTELPDDGYIPF